MTLTPPFLFLSLRDAPERLRQGDEVCVRFWLGLFPVHWVIRIAALDEQGFTDEQVQGPFRFWRHRHRFVPAAADKTLIVDEIEAALSPHPVKALVGALMWVGLPALFAYRRWRTRRMLEEAVPCG